jgi:hypothetical protein
MAAIQTLADAPVTDKRVIGTYAYLASDRDIELGIRSLAFELTLRARRGDYQPSPKLLALYERVVTETPRTEVREA